MLGYYCAYYRYYYPHEFITAFLNNAQNDDDVSEGTKLALAYGIKVTPPKFNVSGPEYTCDRERNIIAKGLASIKHMGSKAPKLLASLYGKYDNFTDLLYKISETGALDSRQLKILMSIDFFSDFGNEKELDNINFVFSDLLKNGTAKQLKKERIVGSPLEECVKRHAVGTTKDGKESASWRLLDTRAIMYEYEKVVKGQNLVDFGIVTKSRNYEEAMGYAGYVTGRDEDRPFLYVKEVFPLKRKKDGKVFGRSVIARSLGSGIETRFTVYNIDYNSDPIEAKDVIKCTGWYREGIYYVLSQYKHVRTDWDYFLYGGKNNAKGNQGAG